MATKDWKQLNSHFFRNFKKPYDLIIYRRDDEWAVQIGSRTSLYDYTRIVFKTRPEAMKFAKSYMRKN